MATALTLIILLITGFSFFPSLFECENTLISSTLSPQQKWQVILFERSCGTTAGFSSHISLVRATTALPHGKSGNIYISKGFPKGYTIQWTDNSSVVISGIQGEVFKKINRLNDILFTFK